MNTRLNISSDPAAAQRSLTARCVAESERLMTLPRHFGHRLMVFEEAVYGFMRRFAPEYRGGFWEFYELENGGFYMAPEHEGTYRLTVETNGYEGLMSGQAAGITVCLFAYSHLSFEFFGEELFANQFERLREFAWEHPEAGEIFAAID